MHVANDNDAACGSETDQPSITDDLSAVTCEGCRKSMRFREAIRQQHRARRWELLDTSKNRVLMMLSGFDAVLASGRA